MAVTVLRRRTEPGVSAGPFALHWLFVRREGTEKRRLEDQTALSLKVRSDRLDCSRLRALLALSYLELNPLSLFEAAVTRGFDGGVVGEQILRSVVGGDEAETLFGVEPLHGSSGHSCTAFSTARLRRSERIVAVYLIRSCMTRAPPAAKSKPFTCVTQQLRDNGSARKPHSEDVPRRFHRTAIQAIPKSAARRVPICGLARSYSGYRLASRASARLSDWEVVTRLSKA